MRKYESIKWYLIYTHKLGKGIHLEGYIISANSAPIFSMHRKGYYLDTDQDKRWSVRFTHGEELSC